MHYLFVIEFFISDFYSRAINSTAIAFDWKKVHWFFIFAIIISVLFKFFTSFIVQLFQEDKLIIVNAFTALIIWFFAVNYSIEIFCYHSLIVLLNRSFDLCLYPYSLVNRLFIVTLFCICSKLSLNAFLTNDYYLLILLFLFLIAQISQ